MPKPGWFLNLKGNLTKTRQGNKQLRHPVWKGKTREAMLKARLKNRMAEFLSSGSHGGVGVNIAGMINVAVEMLAANKDGVDMGRFFGAISLKTGLGGTAIKNTLEKLRDGGFIAAAGWKEKSIVRLVR